ncbi:hypothetical protein BDR03DRAFT_1013724 [Suillus americanus]|nr:hypothetical protein BDR03DRAFT_1013724 [Suillus americanus]
MTPPHPHTRFNVLFRNHLIYHSRSSNHEEAQRSSLETVPEDGPDLLDRPRNTNVDVLDEPGFNCVDCTSSDSDHFSNEQASPVTVASYTERRVSEPSEVGNSAVGAPRLLAEAHISQRQADISDAQPFFTSCYSSYDPVPGYLSIGFPLLPTLSSTYPASIPTTVAASTSSAYNTPQPSNLCGISADDTSSCSAVSCGPSSSSYTLSQSTSSYTDRPTLPSASGGSPSDNSAVDVACTTVISTYQILATTTTLLQPLSSAVTSTTIVMVSSPLPQPSSVPDTTSKPQLPPTIGAIIGGTVGAVVLLALLTFIVLRHRRIRQHSVTPFNLLSTAGPTQVAGSKFQGTSGVVRPSSGSSSFIQYSDACLAEYFWNRSLSCATDHISSHLVDDAISASSVARRYRSRELEKLYPYTSQIPTSD